MGEEYVRTVSVLGSIPRLGRILMYDDFEGGLHWAVQGNAGDYYLAIQGDKVWEGRYAMKISTRVIGAAANDWARAVRYGFTTHTYRLKSTCHWLITSTTNVQYVQWFYIGYTGTERHEIGIRYLVGTGVGQYWNSTGTWTDLPLPGQLLEANYWHRFSLSADFRNKTYLEMESDGFKGSLTAFSYYVTSDTSRVGVQIQIEVGAAGAVPAELYIDTFGLFKI